MTAVIEKIERILMVLGAASGLATLLIMISVVADVSGRFFFNRPIHGATELSELLLVAMVFFGLAATQQNRQNYAIDMIARHLPARLQTLLDLFGYLFCLAVSVTLAWFSSRQALDSFARGEAGFGIVPFPIWPARFILATGLWLLALQFLFDALRLLAGNPRAAATGSHE